MAEILDWSLVSRCPEDVTFNGWRNVGDIDIDESEKRIRSPSENSIEMDVILVAEESSPEIDLEFVPVQMSPDVELQLDESISDTFAETIAKSGPEEITVGNISPIDTEDLPENIQSDTAVTSTPETIRKSKITCYVCLEKFHSLAELNRHKESHNEKKTTRNENKSDDDSLSESDKDNNDDDSEYVKTDTDSNYSSDEDNSRTEKITTKKNTSISSRSLGSSAKISRGNTAKGEQNISIDLTISDSSPATKVLEEMVLNDNAFECLTCKECFETLHKLHNHSLVKDSCRFSCSVCKFHYETPIEFFKHISTHKLSFQFFSCVFCSITHRTFLFLQFHLMETHKFSKNKSMPSDYWRIFANHVKLTEVPVDFTCDLCYDVFRSRKELKTHLEFHYELIKDKPDKVVENCPIEISDDDDDCAVVAKTDSNSKNQSTSKSACHKLPLQPSTALEYKEYNPKKHKRKFVNILPRPDELKKKEHISEPPKKPKKSKKSNVVQKKLKNNSSNVDSSAPNKSNFVATTENQVDGNNIVYIVNQEKSINETVQQISHSSVPMVQTNIPNNQNFGGANNNQVPNNNLVYFMNNSGPARGLGAASNMIYIIPHANVSSNNPLAIGGNNLLGQEQQNITTSISDNSASSNIIIGSKLFGQFNQNPGIITSRNSKLIFLPTTNESVSNATGSINLASSMTNNVTDMQVESSSTDAVSSTTKSNDEKLTLPAESST